MRRAALLLLVAAAAGCNGSTPRPVATPGTATVTLRRTKAQVPHFFRDPERRYPRGPGALCSWTRDRFIHMAIPGSPNPCDVVFLDAAARVVEVGELPAFNEQGITSKVEARHVLILAAETLQKDGLQVGDTVGFSADIVAAKPDPMPAIKVGGHEVHVETSHLVTERQRGLMHRPRLSKDDGMLFLYEHADERGFWMMNTLIALDIAYFDPEGRLVNVCRMKPAADPSQGGELKAPSAAPARFVLEVNYGWFDARGLIDAEGKPKQPVRLEISDALRKLADNAE